MKSIPAGPVLRAVWELYEWFANHVLGGSILVSYDDTIADLLMDGSGSLIAGLALIFWRARGRRQMALAGRFARVPAQ